MTRHDAASRSTGAFGVTDPTQPAISVLDVSKSYGEREVLHDVTLQVQAGEAVALLGPNGAGKTTLVETMLGLRAPGSGTVTLLGCSARSFAATGRVGAMLQSSRLPALVTVRDTVQLFTRMYPAPLPLDEVIGYAGLAGFLDLRTDRLSGGQVQRVRFALAIAGDPDVVFLDEPTVGMDVETRLQFWSTLRAWSGNGKTVLFATHYLDEVNTAADRVIVLRRGHIVADTTPRALRGLATSSTVQFHVDSQFPVERLTALPGVTDVHRRDEEVTVRTIDPDATVAQLYRDRLPVSRLEVTRGRLDDAFIGLTADATP